MTNLFANLPTSLVDELTETVAGNHDVRIERIVSTGQASPDGFWYDQPEDEWVVLLRGEAALRFADREDLMRLRPGDHVTIPAHARHQVAWTSATEPTVWLAVFFPHVP